MRNLRKNPAKWVNRKITVCVCVCVRERERGERRERGKRVSGNEIYGAYDGTGCDGVTKSELFSNFYMYY